MKRILESFLFLTVTLAGPAFAQLTLSGITLWESNASGAWLGVGSIYYNTLGWPTDSNSVSNAYLFTGPTSSPSFLNSANADSTLNPNLSLTAGTHTLNIAGNNSPSTDTYVGLNLYFNGNLSANRISAVVQKDGTHGFSVISTATTTFGETGHTGPGVAGAGSLSYTVGDFTVTLADLSFLPRSSSPDIVSAYSNAPNGDLPALFDTVGTMTLTVTAIPEPATYAALFGLGACLAVAWRRRALGFALVQRTKCRWHPVDGASAG